MEISRVQADSPGRDDRSNRSLNAEWVELTNTTRDAVNSAAGPCATATATGHNTRTDLFQNHHD
ncbi:hypothetical protein [Streptomyces sp. KS 21]|uniref:hypothetical protein n=1 Tax=Streptomyces sp. KS 21 TaxID=2485150 RepID=UPI0026BA2CB0